MLVLPEYFFCAIVSPLNSPREAVLKNLNFKEMNKFTEYLKGSREELAKVIWPSKETTINHTLVVIGISVFVALFLGLVDLVLSKTLEIIIR